MFGFRDCKIEKIDVLLAKNINELFSEEEIYSILHLLTGKEIVSCDIERIELFFSKLKNKLGEDCRWVTLIVDFCNLYSIDIETIIPALKKTQIFEEIRQIKDKKKNRDFLALFL